MIKNGQTLFKSYRSFLREILPDSKEVRKITLNPGFSCPNLDGTKGNGGCTYCNNKGFSPAFSQSKKSISKQLIRGIERVPVRFKNADFMAYFQPFSNTYAPLEILESVYREAINHPQIKAIAIGTRPDCLAPEVIELLKSLAKEIPLILELGLQTRNDLTAQKINRAHGWNEFEKAMDAFKGAKVKIGVHVILGLPGEGRNDFIQTAKSLHKWNVSVLKIHPLHITRGTQMADSYSKGEFDLLSLEDYCQNLAEFISNTKEEVAIERFTGDSPDDTHLGPDWSGDRKSIEKRLVEILEEKKWKQGGCI